MAAEWTDDNTRIITELFVEQVRLGNRPNTHLTPAAYEEVARKFKMLTGKEYKQSQLKNKWDKLKGEYGIFKRLKIQTGGGWNLEKNTVTQDAEWWKKAKKDNPGCGKFKKQGLRNEENLKIMFEDITSDGTDHWNPTSGVPLPSSEALAHAMNIDDIQDLDNEDTEMQPNPSSNSVKRLGKFVHEGSKKPKTAMVMQEQITRIGDVAVQSQSSFESFIRADGASSVKTVMDAVIECGANEGSDEHYIATELFAKRDQREIFMHMSVGSRLAWLRTKYDHKYPK
ncbi:L10-interacting MYB domain-containing protein [Brachypodium distachyon]|uniref:Myb/SANT-like domain-containing protein n=1 Tax=Brachypodium distachyon TaxID=15368 RepID=A0A2K2D2C3_BRADI|nr:L10-interacting MYB domain-containing protein [Brachypodium distachyon]XP_014757244.1 L10-interacting MYB domain-containing protein [Brachypodium distachyon]PNT68418.1 hypothetical protein BRADI_3g40377v3 [Brachypodium distachyon]|eukprot:XP_014757243.1 L10-interacting MYB domain-containing protein [Brachypodium distachyon]